MTLGCMKGIRKEGCDSQGSFLFNCEFAAEGRLFCFSGKHRIPIAPQFYNKILSSLHVLRVEG